MALFLQGIIGGGGALHGLAKLRGTYRWHIVVKCPADADLSDALLPLFRRRKPDRDANVAVDVDPDDLL